MKQVVRLEQWMFVKAEDSASVSGFLRGSVFGHPHIADGIPIQTTNILSMDNGFVQTTNTVYILGHELFENAGTTQNLRAPSAPTPFKLIRNLAVSAIRPFSAAF